MAARVYAVQGRGPSKMRTLFEGAQPFRKVRILENPDDSFEDAHPFPRCAPKTEHLRITTSRSGLKAEFSHASPDRLICGGAKRAECAKFS